MRTNAPLVAGVAAVALLALPFASATERAPSAPLERPTVRFDPEGRGVSGPPGDAGRSARPNDAGVVRLVRAGIVSLSRPRRRSHD